ncbi:hypothetical protein ACFQ1Q_07500 [Winogradskyella litorisediminis]|uniref:Uncharacterized protein n=1 Tax=Winogradskyella litorisediminis TaxID=1156618 RepID=A0ABW3N6W1_9FLAO
MKITKYILVAICLFGNLINAQETGEKISRRITLVEKFTAENYETPQKVMFYTGGNYNMEINYQNLFKKLDKAFKKQKKDYMFMYDRDAKLPSAIASFSELNPKFKNSEYDALCIILAGNHTISEPDRNNGYTVTYNNRMPEYNYDFYLILVEANTNKILLKRKYNVRDTDKFKKDNKELVKVIASEFK